MGMVVRTNTMAMNANRQLGVNNSNVAKSLEKLSSGFRINRAGDDASGLAISEKMKAQIKGLDQASANSQDGISLIQTAEGALTEVHSMLNRMVELATKSANGTIQNEVDRDAIQTEVDALATEITRISKATNFNGINLLDGSLGGSVTSKLSLASGASLSGSETAATKYDATLNVADTDTGVTIKFKDVDGKDVTISATGATAGDENDMLAKLAAADADGYSKLTAAYDVTAKTGLSGSITFKSKVAGTGHAMTGGTAVGAATLAAMDTTTAAGSNATSTITLGAALVVGDKLTFGGKTYTMGAAADATKRTFTTAAELIAQAAADGYTVAGAIATAGDTLAISPTVGGKGGLSLQVGDTNDDFNKVTVSVDNLSASGLAVEGIDVSDQDVAGASIQIIKDAINKVSTNRANMGALQNRLEYTINNLDTTSENMSAANSRIRDTDMAKEMMSYTKNNILTQAAQAMLAQANQQPQAILQLLQ